VWITGLALLAILLRVQFFLSDRMRRMLNPLCLLATLAAGVLLLYTNHALSTSHDQIKVVKEDSFDSIHSLWKAKATAYEANAKESRSLLDKQNAAAQQQGFDKLASLIANDPEKLMAAARAARKPGPDMTGFLADELRNITFVGESQAAREAVDMWTLYMAVAANVRNLERSGKHDKAIELCLGNYPNQSNWSFNGFIKALDRTLAINQKEFDRSSAFGFEVLRNFEVIALVMGLIVALGCLFGILPRIREYSA
jgi:hypothetical protein